MTPDLLAAIYGFAASFVLLWAARTTATVTGLESDPRRLRFYDRVAPAVAGWSVALATVLSAAGVLLLWNETNGDRVYSPWRIRAMTFGVTLAVLILTTEAVRLDRRQSPGYGMWKLIVAMSLLTGAYGVTFDELTVPFVGAINLGLANVLFTTLWVVVLVAMVELLDTLPGVAMAVTGLVALSLWMTTAGEGELLVPVFAASLTGAVLIALPWTTLSRKVLLGKSGNKVLGFLLGMLIILARRKMEAAQLVIIPLVVLIGYLVFRFLIQFGRRIDLRTTTPTEEETS